MKEKGLVVTICAPSQGGKDFVASNIIDALSKNGQSSKYATAYKSRERRANDPTHIKSFSEGDTLPISPENQIYQSIYGNQIIYDKKEIEEAINNGEIIFIATANTELARTIKEYFGNNCVGMFIRRHQVDKDTMIAEEVKRAGGKEVADLDRIEKNVNKRLAAYTLATPEYQRYVKEESGADYLFINWHTLFGGSWNSTIDEKSHDELMSATYFIERVKNHINSSSTPWRENPVLKLSPDDRNANPTSLLPDYIDYINNKHNFEL